MGERTKKGLFKKGCKPGPGRPRGKQIISSVDREVQKQVRSWRRQFGEYLEELPAICETMLQVSEEQLRRIYQLRDKGVLSVNEMKVFNSASTSLRQNLHSITIMILKELQLMKELEHEG